MVEPKKVQGPGVNFWHTKAYTCECGMSMHKFMCACIHQSFLMLLNVFIAKRKSHFLLSSDIKFRSSSQFFL